jgi:hypothetical protein
LVAITERSAPDPNRPKMDDETEKRLHRIEAESAACYADMEDATTRFLMLAQALEEVDGVPDEIDEETSVVNHIDALTTQLKAATSEG